MVMIKDLLGCTPSADSVADYLAVVAQRVSAADVLVPEVKVYPDMVYFNYYRLGISLQFAPQRGYKPMSGQKREQLKDEHLRLEGIDVYNANIKPVSSSQSTFSSYPSLPLEISLDADGQDSRPSAVIVAENTTGKELVNWLGEPSRKGGGTGPLSGSINIWCEWSKDGLMVEFGGEESRGPQAWERGKDAVWRVITVFVPKDG